MRYPTSSEIGIHFIIWVIYFLMPIIILPHPDFLIRSNAIYFKFHILGSVLSMGLFYFNYALALPRFWYKKKYFVYTLAIIIYILLLIWITNIFISSYKTHSQNLMPGNPSFYGFFILRFVVVFMASIGLSLYKRIKSMEMKNEQTELLSLKAQINPHFLFNTLNGIYAQAILKSENTANSILKLSSIMRYAITEGNTDKVLLDKEILYINNYIELQKLRLTDMTEVRFEVIGDTSNLKICPLILICFIENAFKYGVSTEVSTLINIVIHLEDDQMELLVQNQKIKGQSKKVESNQIGLNNAKKQLEMVYGNDFNLQIKETESDFEVNLNLKLV